MRLNWWRGSGPSGEHEYMALSIPHSKFDIEAVEAIVAAGPIAAEPLLEGLLLWLDDINDPVAIPIADFLVTVGAPLVPHLHKVLQSKNNDWIYWVLQYVIAKLPIELMREFKDQLYYLSVSPENDHVAFKIGYAAKLWGEKTAKWMIDNRIRAYRDCLTELTDLKKSVEESESK